MFDTNNSGFSFASLSLSGVQAAAGVSVLKPGRYIVKTKDAEVKDTKNKNGKYIQIRLIDEAGAGVITDRLNVANQNQEAARIGMEQLKALLVHGGHPDPDNVGAHGLASLNNLRVGVVVGSETYNGEQRGVVKGYFNPADGAAPAAKPAVAAPAIGGDIPF